ncbi:MAG: hypothetical protein JRM86_05980 [Nitrososphaerota archaeon]|nr:hypothetical protein [Nitrososphaerota archaeon]MDG6966896.1 hypothetical protein [Nitrososphaerota archaeon]MDG6978700.1 hypothetical protein [Nitrososphaerota archaeon]MDG7006467.1 hypothetical protein [Nitrososphaerota archaeon]MDG7021099.1 hypothetical protein [Nitrososphaerota archaeon]
MRVLRLEYAPTVFLMLAVAQMASLASVGLFVDSYAVAGLFGFFSLASGVAVFLYLRNKNLAAARLAIATGVVFFLMLFGVGEYLFATYIPA